jgi:pyruvate/2-oxoacid:ferredoxin oxidoreductase beta subunit
MTVLTVNINDKKNKKALKALKAVIEGFDLDYQVKENAMTKATDLISIPITEWNEIQKRLNTESLYNEFEESIKAIRDDINGSVKLKNARELLNGH